MSIDHTPPKDFPTHHFAAIAFPADLARVIAEEAAKKEGFLFEDQVLEWVTKGAECSRRHKDAPLNPRKKK